MRQRETKELHHPEHGLMVFEHGVLRHAESPDHRLIPYRRMTGPGRPKGLSHGGLGLAPQTLTTAPRERGTGRFSPPVGSFHVPDDEKGIAPREIGWRDSPPAGSADVGSDALADPRHRPLELVQRHLRAGAQLRAPSFERLHQ